VDKDRNSKQYNLTGKARSLASNEKLFTLACIGSLLVFLSLLYIGVTNVYSGVPFWDEWNGSLEFLTKFGTQNITSIFAQHNEHRIFLFRLIALFNFTFVNGQIWFLIVINLIILVGIVHILYKYIELMLSPRLSLNVQERLQLICILAIIEFSWVQEQNINWGFQSQFLLGIYLPLVAFYFLHKSWQLNQSLYFRLGILFGILSAGTIASGIAVLPLMFLGALICKRDRREIIQLMLISLSVVFLYLQGYSTPGQHGNPLESLSTNTTGVLKYFAVYFASPIIKSFGEQNFLIIFLIIAGLALVVVTYLYRNLVSKNLILGEGVLVLPTLFLLTVIGLTALGRANFEPREALASRYTSVTLVLYIFIGAVYISNRVVSKKSKKAYSWGALALTLVVFFPLQIDALSRNNNAFDQRLSAMSLNLSLLDDEQVSRIFPNPEYVYNLAPQIISSDKGIFGDSFFKKSRSNIRIKSSYFKITSCEVRIDQVFTSDQRNYLKVFGWSFIGALNKPIGDFLVVDSKGKIVGAGISGAIRTDVDSYLKMKNVDAGFAFYTRENNDRLVILNPKNGVACKLPKFN